MGGLPVHWLILTVLLLAAVGFRMGRGRALVSAAGNPRNLHSLPNFYGWNVALAAMTPAFVILALWLVVQPVWIDSQVSAELPGSAISEGSSRDPMMSDVRRIAKGLKRLERNGGTSRLPADPGEADVARLRGNLRSAGIALGSDIRPEVFQAAEAYHSTARAGKFWMTLVVILTAAGGFAVSYFMTQKDFRARNTVENCVMLALIVAASIAIVTTLGIILSMLFETRNFFADYPWRDFFFALKWAPDFRGDSELAILPLLWGTLYISFIALLVAVPIGLYAAIYLSEYASNRIRLIAKPAIEILAGIPTIVYGLFALITVGPLLRDYFAMPLGLGESASSVMTAGLVMGVMLIPFVSSLSDDIINAVPQSLRDGSYGLGATQSETIRQVVIPAALPGIVGAILLAASRAIGETMIVVLGAGAAAAQFDRGLGQLVNPFEAMTTVTVKIVSQLTGDTDFASPETLVAFALGLTLFAITLALNVFALWIVRRYREQYE